MKFLLCGCFHGSVPREFFKTIKKESPDLIIGIGDFPDGRYLRKWEFKHVDEIKLMRLSGKEADEIINSYQKNKDFLKYLKKDINSMENVLKKLSKIKTPFLYTYGNHDASHIKMVKLLKSFSKNNFKFIPKGKVKFNDYNLIFHGGYRGTTGKPYMVDWEKASKKHKLSVKKRISQINKELNVLFSKRDKNAIFITHDSPYNTKLDILKSNYDLRNKGKHIGDNIYTKFDKRFQPLVHICGHMHENQGYDKIGKTLVVNTGALLEGKFVLLELEKDKIKKLKFYK